MEVDEGFCTNHIPLLSLPQQLFTGNTHAHWNYNTESGSVSGLHGTARHMKNLSTSPPPLSSHALTLSYDRRKTTWPVISPVYPTISLSLHPQSKRLWARVYDCLYEHVCAQMYKLERVYVPVLVFENVCASLPLTFCRLGGQENLTRPSKIDYYGVIFCQI